MLEFKGLRLTSWFGLLSISFKWVTSHFLQKKFPLLLSTSLWHDMWTLTACLPLMPWTWMTTAWHTQWSNLTTFLTGTGDDKHLLASHPVIALRFQILPPLLVSKVKALDELAPVLERKKIYSVVTSDQHVAFPQKSQCIVKQTGD